MLTRATSQLGKVGVVLFYVFKIFLFFFEHLIIITNRLFNLKGICRYSTSNPNLKVTPKKAKNIKYVLILFVSIFYFIILAIIIISFTIIIFVIDISRFIVMILRKRANHTCQHILLT